VLVLTLAFKIRHLMFTNALESMDDIIQVAGQLKADRGVSQEMFDSILNTGDYLFEELKVN
jgi:hypothetical protein